MFLLSSPKTIDTPHPTSSLVLNSPASMGSSQEINDQRTALTKNIRQVVFYWFFIQTAHV